MNCEATGVFGRMRNWISKPKTEFVQVGKTADGEKAMMIAVPVKKGKQPSVKEVQKAAIIATVKAVKDALNSINQSFAEVYWMELSSGGKVYTALRLPGETAPFLLTDEAVGTNWFSLLARSMRKNFVQPEKKEYTTRLVCNPNNRFYDGNQIRIPKKSTPVRQLASVPSRFTVERVFCSEYSVMTAKDDIKRAGGKNIYGEQVEIDREIWQQFMNSFSDPLRSRIVACNQSLLEFDTICEVKFQATHKRIDSLEKEEQEFMINLTNTVLDVFSEHEELYRYYRLLFTLEEGNPQASTHESKKSQLITFCASEVALDLYEDGDDLAALSDFSSWRAKDRKKLNLH